MSSGVVVSMTDDRTPVDNGDGTHTIPLTRGYVAIIDSADLPLVANRKWSARPSRSDQYTAYAVTYLYSTRRPIYMHRVLLRVEGVHNHVDHIDGNGLNNRRSNLRVASRSQNLCNRPKPSSNTSGFKGVWYYKARNRWLAEIRHNGVKHRLGYFTDRIEAAKAYDRAARELHGEFAVLNFPAEAA